MTQTLAVEWARHQIRVNAVAPGPIESPGAAQQLWNIAGGGRAHHQHACRCGAGASPRKSLTPWRSSSPTEAGFITGETLTIDGGAWLGPRHVRLSRHS